MPGMLVPLVRPRDHAKAAGHARAISGFRFELSGPGEHHA